jgi:hypothetical protein
MMTAYRRISNGNLRTHHLLYTDGILCKSRFAAPHECVSYKKYCGIELIARKILNYRYIMVSRDSTLPVLYKLDTHHR